MHRALSATILIALVAVLSAQARTDKYRLSWTDDPATTMTVAWNQIDGWRPELRFDTQDRGEDVEAYAQSQGPDLVRRSQGLRHHFVFLRNLKPDTAYYFVVRDSNSVSPRIWFRTAPDQPGPFTFVAGGDSRTHTEPRQDGNRLVARLRPLFVLHGGDYMGKGSATEWAQWLDDWQLTRSADGRMYPLVVVHGNHENPDMQMVPDVFGLPNPDVYYALNVGGEQLRIFVLNTELEPGMAPKSDAAKWAAQRAWIQEELARSEEVRFKMVGYHRLMRPHTSSKAEGLGRIEAWAQAFFDHEVDLVIESDSHMTKYTYPLRPDDGPDSFESFVRDDAHGTVYIGEGGWGAPVKPLDDSKPWTLAADSFYQLKWIHMFEERLEIRTVRIQDVEAVEALSEEDVFRVPDKLLLWDPPLCGTVLHLPFQAPVEEVSSLPFASTWHYRYGSPPPADWTARPEASGDWAHGRAPLGYGEGNERTRLSFGDDSKQKPITAWFTRVLELPEEPGLSAAALKVVVDDGAVFYLNGREVARLNMPEGVVGPETKAKEAAAEDREGAVHTLPLPVDAFRAGPNLIAVEVHQNGPTSSDLRFDAQLELVRDSL